MVVSNFFGLGAFEGVILLVMHLRSGKEAGFPYSLSRWTDVCASPRKWDWFKIAMSSGKMVGFDPTSGVPYWWSLKPQDVLGLIFWTKNPSNLLAYYLGGYRVKVHVTVTGWSEAEQGAPDMRSGAELLGRVVETYGPENVVWRFSPVPMVPDVVDRFETILRVASRNRDLQRVYVSFLQTNDLVPETRSACEKVDVLCQLAKCAEKKGVRVLLCNEDQLLQGHPGQHPNLASGVCAPPEDFLPGGPTEACGCALMVDPFTVNEACSIKCSYCYAADKALSPKRRNTTKA